MQHDDGYAATLTDPRWQRKRLEIFQRDNFACLECSVTTKTLHVHHLSYKPDTQPWEYPDDNFQTLCWECHEKKGDKKFPKKAEINILLNPIGALFRAYRPKGIKPQAMRKLIR